MPTDAASGAIAARINYLFELHRPPADPGRRWRNKEVVAACRRAGRGLSESHLSELRRGLKTNPTLRVLDALAWFFGVQIGYFSDPDIFPLAITATDPPREHHLSSAPPLGASRARARARHPARSRAPHGPPG
jgi:transcriptional regulator with XRE-family HTH domain